MDVKKDAARRWFDRRARSYESGVTSRWRDPVQRASLEALELWAEDRILDVGCGTGRVLAPGGWLVIGDACSDLRSARFADRILRRLEPGHVRLYRSVELGSFLQRARLSDVRLRRLSGGGFAIVRGTRRDHAEDE